MPCLFAPVIAKPVCRLTFAVVLSITGSLPTVLAQNNDPDSGDSQSLAQAGILANVSTLNDNSFKTCRLGEPGSQFSVQARCATVTVPENPLDDDDFQAGKSGINTIDIHIARLSALSPSPTEDPLTILVGGPGQGASEAFATVAGAFEAIRKNRDIYLIDQRGTGRSNKLQCPKTATTGNPMAYDEQALEQASVECQAALQSDPRYYTTSVAVRDLERIRQQLNISQWNLYGVSYGTRVALHYARRYPASIRSMILDAVVAPDVSLGARLAIDAQHSLDKIFARCEATESCHNAFPDLAEKTQSLLQELRENPQTLQFENFDSGQLETIEFTANHLTLTIRMLSYSAAGAVVLPTMLHDAYANGNLAPFARQATIQGESLGGSLASGMHNAVVCTEDQPFMEIDDQLRQSLEQTYLGLTPVNALNASCRHWPAGVIDDDFKEPVNSDIPTLLLSGGVDPITPPANAERVARTLTNALHIVNPHEGHMQSYYACTPYIMARFVERADPDDVDFGCLDRQRPSPFFINANGPTP